MVLRSSEPRSDACTLQRLRPQGSQSTCVTGLRYSPPCAAPRQGAPDHHTAPSDPPWLVHEWCVLAPGTGTNVLDTDESGRILPSRPVERTFGWLGRFRRLTRDYERLAKVLEGWHWLAFLTLIIRQVGFQSQ